MSRRWLFTLVAAVLLCAPFASAPRAHAATSGLVFRVGIVGDDAPLDLANDQSALAEAVRTLQYPRLVEYADSDVTPAPGLADAWTPSPDGRSFTYHLRDGLTWSDGRPLTAADVVLSVRKAILDRAPGDAGDLSGLHVSARGANTVVVRSDQLDQRLPIVPVHVVPQHGDAATIGSGPFVVEQHDRGSVRMVANDKYWEGRPRLDAVEFRVYPNGDALTSALESGAIDAASSLPASQFDRLNQDARVATVFGNDGEYYSLVLDTRTGPFADARVRRALWFAVDRGLLIDKVAGGVGHSAPLPTVARSPVWSFDTDLRQELALQLENDPARVRRLMRASGVDRVPLTIAAAADDPLGQRTARALATNLRGTPFDVRVTNGNDAVARLVHRTPTDDPSDILRAFTCGGDDGRWCDPTYTRLFTSQAANLDPESRGNTVRRMQRMLIAQAPEVPLFHDDVLEAYRTDRWKDIIRQPEDSGPAFFTLSASTFTSVDVAPVFGSDEMSAAVQLLVVLVLVAVVAVVTGLYLFVRSRNARNPAAPAPSAS